MRDLDGTNCEPIVVLPDDIAACKNLGDLDLKAECGRALFEGDALLEVRLPSSQQSIHELLRAGGSEQQLRASAALMPSRDKELEEIHDMVGMQVREEDSVQIAAWAASRKQALRGARATIDEDGAGVELQQIARAVALGGHLRAARAQQGELHD